MQQTACFALEVTGADMRFPGQAVLSTTISMKAFQRSREPEIGF